LGKKKGTQHKDCTSQSKAFLPDNVIRPKFEGKSLEEATNNKIFYYDLLGCIFKGLFYRQYLKLPS